MDSETLKKLDSTGVAILEKLGEATTSGIELFEKEAPQLCAEIIAVGRIYYGTLILIGISLLILCIYSIRKTIKRLGRSLEEDPKFPDSVENVCIICSMIFSIAGIVAGFIMTTSNLYTVCLTFFAPRLYLIEYISYLLKK